MVGWVGSGGGGVFGAGGEVQMGWFQQCLNTSLFCCADAAPELLRKA